MPSEEDLTRAYLATTYSAWDGEGRRADLRIGVRSVLVAEWLSKASAQTALFISGYNPASRLATEIENRRGDAELARRLVDVADVVFAGSGRGDEGAWPAEPSWLAIGVDFAQSGRLAEAFGQRAIVFIGTDAVPRLCLGFLEGAQA